jgi:GT2 family glycosyltransferase
MSTNESCDVVIVNWNSGRRLQQCVNSLTGATSVVVIDNASGDGSADNLVASGFPLEVIFNETNRGFAAACNQGAALGHNKYILFLNPDTRLSPQALPTAIRFMNSREASDVAICGLRLVDDLGRTTPSCARFPKPSHLIGRSLGIDRIAPRLVPPHLMLEWDHGQRRYVDQVMGACLLIRRAVFEDLRGFDERFFMYFEELDLSLRARRRGWRSMFLPDADVFHEGGASSDQIPATRLFYVLRSRILYAYKHFKWWQALSVTAAGLSVEMLGRLAYSTIKLSPTDAVDTIKAFVKTWAAAPEILRIAAVPKPTTGSLTPPPHGTAQRKRNPTFSVLLPTRGGGQLLRGCITSVLNQDDTGIELVVADNANTDETRDVLKQFSHDQRLKVVRHDTLKTVTENWMSALEASTGDYVVVIGDDDCLLPGYFKGMRATIERYERPECIVYNGFSYVFPGAISSEAGSFYARPHFQFDPKLVEGDLSSDYRRKLLIQMFSFIVRYPLNIQLTLFSRRAMKRVPPPFFRQPFPDHFAINSLLLKAESCVYVPEPFVVIGLSNKSFGHFAYGGDSAQGMAYLGSTSEFAGKLPGSELLNSQYTWLELLKDTYKVELTDVDVNRAAYIRRQVAYWLVQYRHGTITLAELRRRARTMPALDWIRLGGVAFDPEAWSRLPRLVSFTASDPLRTQWVTLRPLDGVSNISEFAVWASEQTARFDPEHAYSPA